jgi:hypothetical protein
MIKILYAAGNTYESKLQLERFIEHVDYQKINIKIAGYKNYCIENCTNWILDTCNLPDKSGKYLFSNNKYLDIYEEQIKKFDPDLIISDLEIYTSYLALKLNKKLWHVSNKLYNFAIAKIYKEHINIHRFYQSLYEHSHFYKSIYDLIQSADKNFVYSHFCDIEEKIFLKEGFNLIRPYYYSGKNSNVAKHKYVAAHSRKFELINYLSDLKEDAVLFSEKIIPYHNLICKNYKDKEEYALNVSNCEVFVCHGEESFISDAFYNKRKIKILPDQTSRENMFNYLMYHNIYNYMMDGDLITPIEFNLDRSVKYLHEEIESIYE